MKSVFFRIMHASEFWRVFNIWVAINMVVPQVIDYSRITRTLHFIPFYFVLVVLLAWLNIRFLREHKALMIMTVVLNILAFLLISELSFPYGLLSAGQILRSMYWPF
ncbi:hypothetical protein FJU08_03695 [Martelella alba]|uniref:Uncharacterized protein n=1 Tax=Martelella alba TaxID=2590451 RepID=A0A506UG55_9HYPH|nr:hypothetical protein [Martelella alba]TPW32125.1 hypothetical protein FJU08_03695 [Martelella alba]